MLIFRSSVTLPLDIYIDPNYKSLPVFDSNITDIDEPAALEFMETLSKKYRDWWRDDIKTFTWMVHGVDSPNAYISAIGHNQLNGIGQVYDLLILAPDIVSAESVVRKSIVNLYLKRDQHDGHPKFKTINME